MDIKRFDRVTGRIAGTAQNMTADIAQIESLLQERKTKAIVRIQSITRGYLAKKRAKRVARKLWERAFDPRRKVYFWYNRRTGHSQWKQPRYVDLYRRRDFVAAFLIIRLVRGFLSRRRTLKIVQRRFARFYDAKIDRFYWLDRAAGKTFWQASPWLQRFNLPLSPEDQALYDSVAKIKQLEKQLADKDEEIKEVRKHRYEELEPLVIADRVANASKALLRSKDMQRWTVDQLCAWFVQLKMDEYVPFLFKNRVDGSLFLHLSDEDWEHMGIANKFHKRKLQLVMASHRLRYERKQNGILANEEDDLASEYAPSELSDIIANEEQAMAVDAAYEKRMNNQNEEDDDESSDSDSDQDNEAENRLNNLAPNVLTTEQRQQRQLDAQNMRIELIVRGDGVNYPREGDIVRVRYICMLATDGKIVLTTKNGMQRASVEFVLGVGQLIRGIDRALPLMSVGERSKIFLSPQYAYGKAGLFPHIPEQAELIFDLTLLGFRQREQYRKPLIQALGARLRPYEQSAENADRLQSS